MTLYRDILYTYYNTLFLLNYIHFGEADAGQAAIRIENDYIMELPILITLSADPMKTFIGPANCFNSRIIVSIQYD